MTNTMYGFLLTTIAGLSTMLGTFLIFIPFRNKDHIINGALCFAAGVMITVSLTDLIPEGIKLVANHFFLVPTILIGLIFIVLGLILSMLIDDLLPTDFKKQGKGLYRIGIFSMLAIILHNIPEGIATFMATHDNLTLGFSLAIAIALHNIPEGISISIPIYYGTGNKKKSLLYTFISGISEPFGALLAFWFLSPFINDFMMGILFSMIAGIMLHIASYELLPGALKYQNKRISTLAFLAGCIIMIVSHFIF